MESRSNDVKLAAAEFNFEVSTRMHQLNNSWNRTSPSPCVVYTCIKNGDRSGRDIQRPIGYRKSVWHVGGCVVTRDALLVLLTSRQTSLKFLPLYCVGWWQLSLANRQGDPLSVYTTRHLWVPSASLVWTVENFYTVNCLCPIRLPVISSQLRQWIFNTRTCAVAVTKYDSSVIRALVGDSAWCTTNIKLWIKHWCWHYPVGRNWVHDHVNTTL
jgi:hypothetical protein